jgi:hypothetical protein
LGFSPCHRTSHAKCPSAGNSKQFTDATHCLIAYVLIAIIKKELQLDASLYTCLQILSVSVFEKTQISCALQQTISHPQLHCHANQLILFDI